MTTLTLQVCRVLKLRAGFLGAQDHPIIGMRQSQDDQAETIGRCEDGLLDVVVVMMQSGLAGLNLQSMNGLYPISIDADQQQVQGMYSM